MELKMLREAFGEALVELGEEYSSLVVLDADISSSLKTGEFAKKFPERHINFGVAEQNMLMAAAGLATTGLIPLACTYATFASMRSCEQIRSLICYPKLNVKVIVTHGGIEVGWDGPTHQATEDIAMMRSIPNMTVIVPADATAVYTLLKQAIELKGPVYFRMGRNPVPVIYSQKQEFILGKAINLREGGYVLLVATGIMVAIALQTAGKLVDKGINCSVIDMHTIKPLDTDTLITAAKSAKLVVTLEDHNIIGGLGGAIAECLSENFPRPLIRIGVRDTFAESGEPQELFKKYQMDAESVVGFITKYFGERNESINYNKRDTYGRN
jgi:transketolase